MLCDRCQHNEAVIHIRKMLGEKKQSMHLCRECALATGMLASEDGTVDLAAIVLEFSGQAAEQPADIPIKRGPSTGIRCASCGLTDTEFWNTERLGCARCYEAFAELLTPLIAQMHRGTEHVGKRHNDGADRADSPFRDPDISGLRLQLERAVAAEAYEQAAALRDEIARLTELQDEDCRIS